jgi:hypothetical protein
VVVPIPDLQDGDTGDGQIGKIRHRFSGHIYSRFGLGALLCEQQTTVSQRLSRMFSMT